MALSGKARYPVEALLGRGVGYFELPQGGKALSFAR